MKWSWRVDSDLKIIESCGACKVIGWCDADLIGQQVVSLCPGYSPYPMGQRFYEVTDVVGKFGIVRIMYVAEREGTDDLFDFTIRGVTKVVSPNHPVGRFS